MTLDFFDTDLFCSHNNNVLDLYSAFQDTQSTSYQSHCLFTYVIVFLWANSCLYYKNYR